MITPGVIDIQGAASNCQYLKNQTTASLTFSPTTLSWTKWWVQTWLPDSRSRSTSHVSVTPTTAAGDVKWRLRAASLAAIIVAILDSRELRAGLTRSWGRWGGADRTFGLLLCWIHFYWFDYCSWELRGIMARSVMHKIWHPKMQNLCSRCPGWIVFIGVGFF